MKLLLTAAMLAMFTMPAQAQDEPTGQAYNFSLDIGPGFFTTLDDTADAAGVEAYLAAAFHPSKRFALGVRVNATTIEGEDGVAKIAGAPWGFGRAYLLGVEGGLLTYVEVAVSTRGTIAVRGGAEIGVSEGVAAFATADGRKLSDDESKDLLGLSGGLRMKF